MRRMALVLAGIALLGATGAMEVTPHSTLVRTLECLRNNTPSQLSVSDLRVEAQGTGVTTRFMSGRLYSRRDERGLRAMLHITAPQDLAGVRYLLVEDEPQDALYLYLPSLGKVRRLSGAGPEAQIAGTSLDLGDLRLVSQALRAASITMESATTVGGRPAKQLRFVPAIADSPYRRIVTAVDDQTCAILRADFQGADKSLKHYEIDPASLLRSGRYAYASRATIEDRVRGTRAQVSLGGVSTSAQVSSALLDPKSFHKRP
ncbi:MAG: outer rane lipoproteinsorting protein [Panacagrimonas sp.]|nr:outer membrane lipoprotein-sorting protein [Panacagrimonas sp.]MCC2658556.1 outer rane lipoproteinsorting protein [Panacagrimonas sp.]